MHTRPTNLTDIHQGIQLLLPWYINQSLNPDEYQLVNKHVRHCLACRQELLSLQSFARAVTQPTDLETAAEISYAKMRSQLSAGRDKIPPTLTPVKAIKHRHGLSFGRACLTRFALAASLLLSVLPVTQPWLATDPVNAYATHSASQPELGHGQQLRVVFGKSLSDTDVSTILESIHGKKTDAGNSVGAFTVSLDSSEKLTDVIAWLRSRPDIVLVEPIGQP